MIKVQNMANEQLHAGKSLLSTLKGSAVFTSLIVFTSLMIVMHCRHRVPL